MQRSTVVLPEPFGPTRATRSAAVSVRSSERTTSWGPKLRARECTTSTGSATAGAVAFEIGCACSAAIVCVRTVGPEEQACEARREGGGVLDDLLRLLRRACARVGDALARISSAARTARVARAGTAGHGSSVG